MFAWNSKCDTNVWVPGHVSECTYSLNSYLPSCRSQIEITPASGYTVESKWHQQQLPTNLLAQKEITISPIPIKYRNPFTPPPSTRNLSGGRVLDINIGVEGRYRRPRVPFRSTIHQLSTQKVITGQVLGRTDGRYVDRCLSNKYETISFLFGVSKREKYIYQYSPYNEIFSNGTFGYQLDAYLFLKKRLILR